MFERSYESIRVFATDVIISQVIFPRALLHFCYIYINREMEDIKIRKFYGYFLQS